MNVSDHAEFFEHGLLRVENPKTEISKRHIRMSPHCLSKVEFSIRALTIRVLSRVTTYSEVMLPLLRQSGGPYIPVCRPLAQNASFLAFHTANLDSWLLAQNLVSVLRRTGSADSAEHSRSSCAERPGCSKAAKWSPFFSSLSPLRRAFGRRLLQRRTP